MLFVLLSTLSSYSQDERVEFVVDFKVGQTKIQKGYKKNSKTLKELSDFLEKTSKDSTVCVIKTTVCGYTSPEGAYETNYNIAISRIESIIEIIEEGAPKFKGCIHKCEPYIPYERFEYYIRNANLNEQRKSEIISILREDFSLVPYSQSADDSLHIDARIVKLAQYDNGNEWNYFKKEVFPLLRYSFVDVDIYKKVEPLSLLKTTKPATITAKSLSSINLADLVAQRERERERERERTDSLSNIIEVSDTLLKTPQSNETPQKRVKEKKVILEKFTIKTNGIGWLMLISNGAAELHFTDYWSLNLPFYYSGGINYFTDKVKFRGIVFQPEARFHFQKAKGLFVGAHAGIGWYNFALNQDYRIQDANFRPAIGGGLSIGYRFHFPDLPRWGMEFTIGAGAYDAIYDKFYNEENGPLAESNIHKTFIGIDNASVSIIYSFGKKVKKSEINSKE